MADRQHFVFFASRAARDSRRSNPVLLLSDEWNTFGKPFGLGSMNLARGCSTATRMVSMGVFGVLWKDSSLSLFCEAGSVVDVGESIVFILFSPQERQKHPF